MEGEREREAGEVAREGRRREEEFLSYLSKERKQYVSFSKSNKMLFLSSLPPVSPAIQRGREPDVRKHVAY